VNSLRQNAGANGPRLRGVEGAKKCVADQEAVMTEVNQFRQYAEEAMHGSSRVKDENEKQVLVDLAFTWALAALMSDRVLGVKLCCRDHVSVMKPAVVFNGVF
jgi:hypothetical protein